MPAWPVVDEVSTRDVPCCTSVAVAFVTSLKARVWAATLESCSLSLMLSDASARLRRVQSIIAMRVLSPGASDMLWSNWPRVSP